MAASQIEQLAFELNHRQQPLNATIRSLPNGLAFLDVGVGQRTFVLAYYPSEDGFGVDEVLQDEGFEMGYKYWFKEFEPAKAKLLAMLEDAS